jgi:DNA-binding SARP family transcriptional activator
VRRRKGGGAVTDSQSHMPGKACRLTFEQLPSGVLLAERGGRITGVNRAARRLLGPAADDKAATCCAVFGCRREGTVLAGACITELALAATEPLPEVRVDLLAPHAGVDSVWIIAAPLVEMPEHAVLELRPGASSDRRRRTEPHWLGQTKLRVRTLGRTHIDSEEGPLDGEWLGHRPGEVLKFLVCHRGRPVPTEELLETFWPLARGGGAASLRQTIHVIRQHLEPRRSSRRQSSFVIGRKGGYELNLQTVWIDADEFEHSVRVGLGALARRDLVAAEQALAHAATLRRGDFLADEPYADWVLSERDRLRDLATLALRTLSSLRLMRGDLVGAMWPARDLADLQPLDLDTQRDLLRLLLLRGQYSEASRRLDVVRRHWRRTFGDEPDIDLAELRPPPAGRPSELRRVAGGY